MKEYYRGNDVGVKVRTTHPPGEAALKARAPDPELGREAPLDRDLGH
jgi:hypothetical protein